MGNICKADDSNDRYEGIVEEAAVGRQNDSKGPDFAGLSGCLSFHPAVQERVLFSAQVSKSNTKFQQQFFCIDKWWAV